MRFAFPFYFAFLPAFGGVALLAWAWSGYRRDGFSYVVIKRAFIGLVFSVLLGPGLLLSEITIHNGSLTSSTGFWFSKTSRTIDLRQVKMLRITSERNRFFFSQEKWTMYYKGGSSEVVNLGDLGRINSWEIAGALKACGVNVEREA